MTERLRRDSYSNAGYISGKMANDFGLSPRKTMLILVIVAGCFAILWPKVFYPMLVGCANRHIKPSPIDRTKGCCDVISETDIQTLKIMSEICNTIIKKDEDAPLTGREWLVKCRSDILDTCGIDISTVLQEQVRLGQTTKQILDEVRSLNGSLCLKYNFGVAPWTLGVPHRVTVKVSPSFSIRQERPPHLRSEMVHPAFRERGRAIPQTQPSPKPSPPSRLIQKVVPGRPGPLPGMRPTLGGAGHVVPPPKQGTGSMGLIMPIYTIGIVIFFTYTVMKVVFKKQPEVLYPSVEPDPNFRAHVFEPERIYTAPKVPKDGGSSKIVVNAMSALLDEVNQELFSRRKTGEGNDQDVVANGGVLNQDEDQASVKVVGMETTASCEGGRRWSRPESPVLPASHLPTSEPVEPPQEIFLEGALPPQSHLLVTDSATEEQNMNSEEDPAVVLAGKMTLSVISLDSSENGTDESSNSGRKYEERSSSNVSEEFEKIEIDSQLDEQIDDIIEKARNIGLEQSFLDDIRKELDEENEPMIEVAENVDGLAEETYTGSNGNIQFIQEEGSPQTDDYVTEEQIPATDEKHSEVMNLLSEGAKKELPVSTDTIETRESIESLNEEIILSDATDEQNENTTVEEHQSETNVSQSEQNENEENQSCVLAENGTSSLPTETVDTIKDDEPAKEYTTEDHEATVQESAKEYTSEDHEATVQEPAKESMTEDHEATVQEGLVSEETLQLEEKQPEQLFKEEKPLEDSPAIDIEVKKIPSQSTTEENLKQLTDGPSEAEETEVEAVEKPETVEKVTEPPVSIVSSKENGTLEKVNGSGNEVAEEEADAATNEEEEDNDEDGEEIEYEYEESDEDVDEEIRNAERMDDLVGAENVERMNGGVHDKSKNGGRDSDFAENEISEEDDSDDQDAEEDEVEEIIEYVTDEEEEEIEVVEPAQTNNVNHVNEGHRMNE